MEWARVAKVVRRKSLYGDWRKAEQTLGQLNRRMTANINKATRINAVRLRDRIKEKIRDGDASWPAISGVTADVKGSSKPLIDTGDLMNSVSAVIVKPGYAFIGVPRTAGKVGTSVNAESMVNIAAVHEYGHPGIRPKRGRALAIPTCKEAVSAYRATGNVRAIKGLFKPKGRMVLMNQGGKVMFILTPKVTIPPRSFIGSTFAEYEHAMRMRYRQAAAAALRGKPYVAR
jgi:hypothetical protein